MRFNKQLKGNDVSLSDDYTTATSIGSSKKGVVLSEFPLSKNATTKWGFHIKNLKHWIAVGIGLKNVTVQKNYFFNGPTTTGHGM